jgi:hypothetical protein
VTDEGAVARCIANSLAWYRAVLTPHGVVGAVAHGLWTSHDDLPPYYSNAVTVAPGPVEEQVASIAELAATLGRPSSVKDSFDRLDLAALGFRSLFVARWIWREAGMSPLPRPTADADWRRVATAGELDAWETAWREHGSPADRRVFLPGLLDDPSVHQFAMFRGDRIVAGFAANRSGGVLGLSNIFGLSYDDDERFASVVARTTSLAPGQPIVGFEHGADLERAMRCGFRSVGRLRVWAHDVARLETAGNRSTRVRVSGMAGRQAQKRRPPR